MKQEACREEVMPNLRNKREGGVGQAKTSMEENLAARIICVKAHVEDWHFV